MTLRLVLVEDQALMLEALAGLLELERDFSVVGRFDRPTEALAAIPALAADVIVADVEMPGMDGIALVAALRGVGLTVPVLMLSTFGRPGYVERALAAGARGYILKASPPARLTDAIRRVARGQTQIESALLDDLGSESRRLSERERVLIGLMRQGLTNAEIAATLGLRPGTVRNQVSDLLARLEARNRTEAVRIAHEGGWM
ncbi:MAG TPA: response regulator transcription factor [Caulobacter sp.]|nr:response regulator transcription factor [Caulobacter sp.]